MNGWKNERTNERKLTGLRGMADLSKACYHMPYILCLNYNTILHNPESRPYSSNQAYLVGEHMVCLLHILQHLQCRVQIRVLHIALDQSAVTPYIQSHT